MANFNHPNIAAHLREFEGGYVNDPADAGGETCCGIARKHNPDWAGFKVIDQVKAANTTMATIRRAVNARLEGLWLLAMPLYKSKYWDPLNLDQVQLQELAAQVFDTAVNMGVSAAAKMLQKSAGMHSGAVDGKIGPATLTLVNARPLEIHAKFHALRAARYQAIVKEKPQNEKFLAGWMRRAKTVATVDVS